MKNKKTIYFLLPVVVLIWSAIVYQFYSGTGEDAAYAYQMPAQGNTAMELPQKKAYSLLLNYSDPFLSGGATGVRAPSRAKAAQEPAKKQPPVVEAAMPPAYDWAQLKYKGLVEHKGKKKVIALLEIRGQSYMLAEGALQQEVLLQKIWKDSVQVKVGKESTYIRK